MLRTTALLQAGEEARAALEEKLSVYVENLEYLQGQVETGGSQISRGNAAVERLQGEGRQLRDKIKLKSEIIRKQVQRVTMSTLLFSALLCSARVYYARSPLAAHSRSTDLTSPPIFKYPLLLVLLLPFHIHTSHSTIHRSTLPLLLLHVVVSGGVSD